MLARAGAPVEGVGGIAVFCGCCCGVADGTSTMNAAVVSWMDGGSLARQTRSKVRAGTVRSPCKLDSSAVPVRAPCLLCCAVWCCVVLCSFILPYQRQDCLSPVPTEQTVSHQRYGLVVRSLSPGSWLLIACSITYLRLPRLGETPSNYRNDPRCKYSSRIRSTQYASVAPGAYEYGVLRTTFFAPLHVLSRGRYEARLCTCLARAITVT